MIKVLIKSVIELPITITSKFGKLFSGTGSVGSEYKNRSLFQQWGFTSLPKENSQGIVIKQGNNMTCIATEADESDKPLMEVEGDVAIYTAKGMFIKINADGEIQIKGNGNPNSIRLGTSTLKKLITEDVLTLLESATMPVSGAIAGPYPVGTFTVPPGNKTSETAAS